MPELIASARAHYTNIVSFVSIALAATYVALFTGNADRVYVVLILTGLQVGLVMLLLIHHRAFVEFKAYRTHL